MGFFIESIIQETSLCIWYAYLMAIEIIKLKHFLLTAIFYANQYWDINEGGETKFIMPADMLDDSKEIKTDTLDYPVVLSIAPIPGRLVIFKGNLLHSATGFRNTWRFTPTIQFYKTGDKEE